MIEYETLPFVSVVTLLLQSSNYYIREASSSENLEVCFVIQKGNLERDVSITIVATNGTGEKLRSHLESEYFNWKGVGLGAK